MRQWMAGLVSCVVLLSATTTLAQKSPFPVSTSVVFQEGATANGNGSSMRTGDTQTLGVQLVVTGSATVNLEGKIGGTTWSAITCYPTGSVTASTAMSASGIFRCNTLGVPEVRARISSYGSGTVSAYGFATSVGPLPIVTP